MKLFRDYAVLAGGQIAGKVLGFIAFAWLARALDPAGYAAVEYVVGLSMLFGTLVEGGFGAVAVRRVARDPALLPRLARQIPWARFVVMLPAVPVMVLVAVSFSRSVVPANLAWLFALGLIALPWRQDWLLQVQERMGQAALAQLVKAALFAAVVVSAVHAPGDLALTGAAELAGALAMTAYCVWVQHRAITPVELRGTLTGLYPVAREAAVAGLGAVAVPLHAYTPLFMIAPIAGALETAWFAAAARVAGSFMVFSYLYHYSLFPAVSRATAGSDARLGALFAASGRVTAWAGILVALALTVVAKEIVVAAFGPRMAPAAPVLQVLAWMLPVALVSGHARWGLAARGAQGSVLMAQLVGLATTVTMGALLGPSMGALGFAGAALCGALIVWVVSHQRALRAGARPPPLVLALRPLACALALLLVVRHVGLAGWSALAVVAPYALLALLVDRALVADLAALARAKADVSPEGKGR